MPYIHKNRRPELEPTSHSSPRSPGELAYQLARVCTRYIDEQGRTRASLVEAVGALAYVQQELFRRVAAPLENGKRQGHGDVF